jgi:5-methylcytosine-specific restriction endonuclease McrA
MERVRRTRRSGPVQKYMQRRRAARSNHLGEEVLRPRIHARLVSKERRKMVANLLARDGRCCGICNKVLSRADFTLDHIIPRSRGGSNASDNLRILCESCNNGRHDDNHFTSFDLTQPEKPQVINLSPGQSSRSASDSPASSRVQPVVVRTPKRKYRRSCVSSDFEVSPSTRITRSMTARARDDESQTESAKTRASARNCRSWERYVAKLLHIVEGEGRGRAGGAVKCVVRRQTRRAGNAEKLRANATSEVATVCVDLISEETEEVRVADKPSGKAIALD